MAQINQAINDLVRYNGALLPSVRSRFDKSHSHATTLDSGFIVPLMYDRVVPGDEKEISYSGLCRMATPKFPTMDEANLDVYAFYIPDRLWWRHAKEFYGENKDADYNEDGDYTMPYLKPSQYMVDDEYNELQRLANGIGSLSDYFGFPLKSANSSVSQFDDVPQMRVTAGLHRCYQLIYNEYFRNSSIVPAVPFYDGDTVTDAEWDVIKQIQHATKYPDYFTTLLLRPQDGADVLLPLGDYAPVVTRDEKIAPIYFNNGLSIGGPSSIDASGVLGYGDGVYTNGEDAGAGYSFGVKAGTTDIGLPLSNVYPNNLWANLTDATSATINQLRNAITIQHLLEISSIAGKRYQGIMKAHFDVFVPDATLQRPELLGSCRQRINVRQVLSTTANDEKNLGSTGAVSVTAVDSAPICNRAFTEPGILMVVGVIRTSKSYSQGLDPLLTKLDKYDHYWKVFDRLGNQPVPITALVASPKVSGFTTSSVNNVLGYQEAWTEYKTRFNRVSGLFRPDAQETLSAWNYAEHITTMPTLSKSFVEENDSYIERSVIAQSEPQFLLDCYFSYYDTKSMSIHSVPGLTRL